MDTNLGNSVDGLFGLDKLSYGSGISVKNTAIGAFNSTDFWLGFFGLGITSETINGKSDSSPISQLVEVASEIPSHSYGYTAGASYRKEFVILSFCGFTYINLLNRELLELTNLGRHRYSPLYKQRPLLSTKFEFKLAIAIANAIPISDSGSGSDSGPGSDADSGSEAGSDADADSDSDSVAAATTCYLHQFYISFTGSGQYSACKLAQLVS